MNKFFLIFPCTVFIICLISLIIVLEKNNERKIIQPIIIKETSSLITYSKNCTITAYTACKSETDNTPYMTALMTRPVSGWTCAVSHDLLKFLGKKVYIKGYGVRKITDLMNKRYKNSIDLFVGTKKDAKEIGKNKHEIVFIN